MDFQIFHNYNRLVRRGLAKPLEHSCGGQYVLAMGEKDLPVLKCYSCNTTTLPGTKMYGDIKAVVEEWFV